MDIKIQDLRRKDFYKAVRFAITGMHFEWYFEGKLLRKLYGWYFWYMEMARATQVLAAYRGDKLAGVLLAEIKGETKKHGSLLGRLYVGAFDFLQRTFYKESAGVYEEANREMFAKYAAGNFPDGEILFLAADPEKKAKGVGSRLLCELERRERGKKIYLYTDSACTYPFYERRGFERSCEKEILLDIGGKRVPLTCFLFSKTLE